MVTKNTPAYEFSYKITGSTLPTDTFLEKLREDLLRHDITSTQTQEKTGEAHTTGVGMTIDGDIGGGIAHSNILTNKWNPFNIQCPAKEYTLLGHFQGQIKLTEMAKYSKQKKDTHYEMRDYTLKGDLDYSPSKGIAFVLFFIGIYLSFQFSVGFVPGIVISLGLPAIFYVVAHNFGNTAIDFPEEKIKKSVAQFEEFLKKHNEHTMN